MQSPRARVYFRSLGCAKNQLDTEVMLGALATRGFALAEQLDDADVAVVNTCSFIGPAREESVEAILELAELRDDGRLRALLVAGCLPQRYGAELARELPEVDAFVGTGDFPRIAEIVDRALAGEERGIYVEAGRTHLYDDTTPRILLGPTHSAYIKIAEGCDRICAFCAIPGIRGRFQSRTAESLLAETSQLAAGGVHEINLVAQDSTSWGKDLDGRPDLAGLLQQLDRAEKGPEWLRVLYLYPSAVTDALIEVLGGGRRLLPYVDVPLQHASDPILKAMRRGTTEARQRKLVERLRAGIDGLTLRTTLIVGFPGETDADFEQLCEFVRDVRFDRVGVFRYSDEEGTAGFELPNKVPREVAIERHRALIGILSTLQRERLEKELGREVRVLVDQGGPDRAVGRSSAQAPEIDGQILLRGGAEAGSFVTARITAVRGADLEAEL